MPGSGGESRSNLAILIGMKACLVALFAVAPLDHDFQPHAKSLAMRGRWSVVLSVRPSGRLDSPACYSRTMSTGHLACATTLCAVAIGR